jgi:hypothetical protein
MAFEGEKISACKLTAILYNKETALWFDVDCADVLLAVLLGLLKRNQIR